MDTIIQPSELEELVAQILRANGFKIRSEKSLTVDFVAELNGIYWAIEVKFYRSARANISLIGNAAAALVARGNKIDVERAMLVVSCYLPPEMRESLENTYKLLLVDRVDLSIWALKDPVLAQKLEMILDDHSIQARGGDAPTRGVTFDHAVARTNKLSSDVPPEEKTGRRLCEEIRNLGYGTKNWRKFEELCENALKYLFSESLRGWASQQRTIDNRNIYDLVCRVNSSDSFWEFIGEQLNSKYVLFEFKNYRGPIKKLQILTTECYLLENALRRAAIVITRRGADDSAYAARDGAMREHGKLILIIDEREFCQMLHMKDEGEDPSELLFRKTDEFLLSLSR
jgi:hypothetical protein